MRAGGVALGRRAALSAGSTAARCVYNNADPYLPDLLICRPELADDVLAALPRLRSLSYCVSQVWVSRVTRLKLPGPPMGIDGSPLGSVSWSIPRTLFWATFTGVG